jgi:hemoglobin
MPEISEPNAPTPFDTMGGEAQVRALVDHFYDLMDLEPAYRALRQVHHASLDNARDKLFWFLCGWLGGPQHYVERFGHPRLRARHLPFVIGIKERDQWLACMAPRVWPSPSSTPRTSCATPPVRETATGQRKLPVCPSE